MGRPLGTDFVGFWSAGLLALEGRAADAYDYHQQFAMEQKALPWENGETAPRLPFPYPPMFLMGAAVLARLPYGLALGVFMAATVPIYLASIRGIVPGRDATMAALAFPAVLSNLSHGQNGFLTAGLLGGALLLLERKPWVAGILFGLLAYKPQFALLVPLALAACGCRRAMASAAVTVAATAGGSWAAFGSGTWHAFLESLQTSRIYGLEQGATGWEKMQSIFSAVRLSGGSIPLAYGAQAIFSVAAAAAVAWVWRRRSGGALRGAALATAVLMVTPYVLDYDLIVLALPIAWLAATGLREGFLPWEKIVLLSAWLLPLVSRRVGGALHLSLAPIVLTALLAIILRRVARRPASPADGVRTSMACPTV